jgi:hypothetical protein
MTNRTATFFLVISLMVPSCQLFDGFGGLEQDPRWVMLNKEVQDRAAEVQDLVESNRVLYKELEADGVSAERLDRISSQLLENFDQLGELADFQGRAKVDLAAIAEEHEIPGWQLTLAAASSALVGMGVPTSGPLAPILAGIAPILERLGIRNRRRREDWHGKRKQ